MSNIIEIPEGNDVTWNVNLENADGTDFNATGYTIYFTVKKTTCAAPVEDPDDDAIIQKTVVLDGTPATKPQGTLTILGSDTLGKVGTYIFDYALFKDGKKRNTKTGTLKIIEVVTDRAS